MKYLLLVFASLIVLASCQKTPTSTDRAAMLRSGGRWKISNGTVQYKTPYNHYWSTDSVVFGITKLFTYNTGVHDDTSVSYTASLNACNLGVLFSV